MALPFIPSFTSVSRAFAYGSHVIACAASTTGDAIGKTMMVSSSYFLAKTSATRYFPEWAPKTSLIWGSSQTETIAFAVDHSLTSVPSATANAVSMPAEVVAVALFMFGFCLTLLSSSSTSRARAYYQEAVYIERLANAIRAHNEKIANSVTCLGGLEEVLQKATAAQEAQLHASFDSAYFEEIRNILGNNFEGDSSILSISEYLKQNGMREVSDKTNLQQAYLKWCRRKQAQKKEPPK